MGPVDVNRGVHTARNQHQRKKHSNLCAHCIPRPVWIGPKRRRMMRIMPLLGRESTTRTLGPPDSQKELEPPETFPRDFFPETLISHGSYRLLKKKNFGSRFTQNVAAAVWSVWKIPNHSSKRNYRKKRLAYLVACPPHIFSAVYKVPSVQQVQLSSCKEGDSSCHCPDEIFDISH